MVRFLIILCNAFSLLLAQLFTPDDGIVVKSNIPPGMTAGTEVPIELIVSKGSMGGFAKLQLELPEGFVVKEAEEAGASYTFIDGIAKWVWATLPAEPEIIIKLIIIPSETSIGAQTIAAKYSYVENNQKQSVDMVPVDVMVVAPGEAVPSYAAVTPATTQSASPDSTSVPVNTAAEPARDIVVERSISQGSSLNEFVVNLTIKKRDTKGFARYSDDLPAGLEAKALETEGGSFSVAEGKLKFVWVNVPEKEELKIAYALSGSSTEPVILKGEYSYLENNQSKKVLLNEETINFQSPVVVEDETKKETPVTQTETPVQPAETQTLEPEPVAKTEAKRPEVTGNVPAPSGTAYYCVQIGAFKKKKVSAQKLEKKFKITEPIRSEMQGGFSKFLVGSHQDYKGARDHREEVKSTNNVKSAFVAAYAGGKRITVQEALMINNQQWFR